jgi:long-chain acyl-CoA synthetase
LETVNFKTLALRSGQMAGLVHSLGIRRGQRVMILAENRPEWPIAVFGLALAGAVSLPLSPEGVPDSFPVLQDAGGEAAGVSALCVTRRTVNMAAGLDPALPRIYLDSPAPGKLSPWTSITVSIGGLTKQLPLPRSFRRADKPEADETALCWPDGTQYSHRELLALAGGDHPWPRLFPRDRLIALCSLAEPGALILGILAAVLGGASLSCVDSGFEEAQPRREELLHAIELLRPTVLLGDGSFLEGVYAERAAPLADGPLSRNFLTGPLARRLGGRRFLKSLGGNIRFYGIVRGPPLSEATEQRLGPIHLPRMRIPGDPAPHALEKKCTAKKKSTAKSKKSKKEVTKGT